MSLVNWFMFGVSRKLDKIGSDLTKLLKESSDNAETLNKILKIEESLMTSMQDLESAVRDESTVIDGAVTLLDQLHTDLQTALNNGDPTEIQNILDSMKANKDRLAAAVVTNTPAAVTTSNTSSSTDSGSGGVVGNGGTVDNSGDVNNDVNSATSGTSA